MYGESSALEINRKNGTGNSLLPQKTQRAINKTRNMGNSDKSNWNEKTAAR